MKTVCELLVALLDQKVMGEVSQEEVWNVAMVEVQQADLAPSADQPGGRRCVLAPLGSCQVRMARSVNQIWLRER